MKRVIVTNGQSGVDAIQRAGIEADLLSWDDVLHDGAVPLCADLSALSEIRATELSRFDWGSAQEITRRFKDRDLRLKTALQCEEIICWFEHDLYDQLQLWQVLSELKDVYNRVSVICKPEYISHHSPAQLASLFDHRKTWGTEVYEEVHLLWDGFRQEHPLSLHALSGKLSVPFADATIERWKRCFPSIRNGLNRAELNTLDVLAQSNGTLSFSKLFRMVNAREEAEFMGDSSFSLVLGRLNRFATPLVELQDAPKGPFPEIFLTEAGRRQMAKTPGEWAWDSHIDYWVGGVHLHPASYWVYDEEADRFSHVRSNG